MWELLRLLGSLLGDLPKEVWPRLLLGSPVLRRLVTSSEVLGTYALLQERVPKLRDRLAHALHAERLVSEEERDRLGLVPLLQRLAEHLRTLRPIEREEQS